MGFVHRDLKPDNIMINLDPIHVRIIDFNRVNLTSTRTMGSVRGTPGYFPCRENLEDGSIYWDIWSMGAIILEANMQLDGYFHTADEKDARTKAVLHLKEPKTCKHLARIVRETLIEKKVRLIISWEEMIKELKLAQFKRQGHDLILKEEEV
jgi:serine/threonine protein kinase